MLNKNYPLKVPSYKLIILEQAVSEIQESCFYYNKKKPGLGHEFEEEIFQLIELIKDTPLLFPIKFAHIHEATVARFPFVITYEVSEKQINVLSIFHAKQHPDKKVKRKRK